MAWLLDTHVLLLALYEPDRLAAPVRTTLEARDQTVWFSAATIWEIALKYGRGKPDFTANPYTVRSEALAVGFGELPIDPLHCAAVITLPPLHTDPFDRLFVAQATALGHTLITHDPWVAAYPGPIWHWE